MKLSKYTQDIAGQKFGMLTAIKFIENKNGFRIWECLCDCGGSVRVKSYNLLNKLSRSCRCQNHANRENFNLSKHPLYSIWHGMKTRCYNKKAKNYNIYGGRGVCVCKEWLDSFKLFYDWAISNGWGKGLQLDKDIKGDGFLYSPSSCSFVTAKKNMNARRNSVYVEYNGKKLTVSQWAVELGFTDAAIRTRIKNGWSAEKALTQKPAIRKKRIKFDKTFCKSN